MSDRQYVFTSKKISQLPPNFNDLPAIRLTTVFRSGQPNGNSGGPYLPEALENFFRFFFDKKTDITKSKIRQLRD